MPHLGRYFCDFWHTLIPKCLTLGPCWRPAGHQMAAQIAQVAQKYLKNLGGGPPWDRSWNEPASNVALEALLGTILVDLGWILHVC